MAKIPDKLLEPVTAQEEEVVGLVLTTGEHVFTHRAEPIRVPVWWVVTQHRCWFIATIDDQHWFVADGQPENIRIDSTWRETRVWIGPWNMPLRAGTRRPAKQLLKRWKTLATDLGPLPEPLPDVLRLVGSKADGAEGLPEWWARLISGQPDERWLLGIDAGLRYPFNAYSGSIVSFPLYIGISDKRTLIASRSAWGELWSEELTTPLKWKKPLVGKLKVGLNARFFYAPRTKESHLSSVRKFKGADEQQRWAIAASRALALGDILRACQLWAEAIRRKQDAALWLDLAATVFAYDQSAIASTVILRTVKPTDTSRFKAWSEKIKPIRKAVRESEVAWEQLQRALHPTLERFVAPQPPDGLPFPPSSPSETWAYALGCAGHWREAQTLWSSLPDNARSRQGIAACLGADPATDGTDAWLAAARACRAEGLQQEAYDALERVAIQEDQATTRWLRAEWAWEDNQRAIAHRWWTKAIEADPSSSSRSRKKLSPTALHALASHAARIDAHTAALHALHELVERDAEDVVAYWKQAQIALNVEKNIEKTVQLLTQATKHDERLGQSEDPPRWLVWSTLANCQAKLGNNGEAVESMAQAIRGDFLQLDAYEAALACSDITLPPELQTWWSQLAALLRGEAADEHPLTCPSQEFEQSRLHALHPGGTSWLDQLRSNFEEAELPSREQLIRGLEAAQTADVPELSDLANRLGMGAPEAFWFRGEGGFGCSSWPLQAPIVIIGREHETDGPRKFSSAQWRFCVGAELAHLRCEHPVLAFDDGLIDSGKNAFKSFGKYAGTASNVVDIVTLIPGVDQVAKLQKLIRISRALAVTHSTLDKAAEVATPALKALGLLQQHGKPSTAGREGWAGASLQNRLHADRIALLLCGDPVAAIRSLLKSSSTSLHLVDSLEKQGLVSLLTTDLPPDEVLRIGALYEFSAYLRPDLWKNQ